MQRLHSARWAKAAACGIEQSGSGAIAEQSVAGNGQGQRQGPSCTQRSIFVLVVLTLGLFLGLLDGIDAAGLAYVHSFSSPELTRLAGSLNRLGEVKAVYAMAAVTAGALILLGHRAVAIRLIVVMGVALAANTFVKNLIARPRPEPFFGTAPDSYSFTSGHALFAACFYGFIGLLVASGLPDRWQRAVVLLPTAALIGAIGLARIYQGVHHPSDVVAGFALAALILCATGAPGTRDNTTRG